MMLVEPRAAAEDVAAAMVDWAGEAQPWAVLMPSTMWGRELAGRLAVRLGAGLTGDAVDLEVGDGRLIAWKPAFGGQLIAAIGATSAVQMATVRAGVLSAPGAALDVERTMLEVEPPPISKRSVLLIFSPASVAFISRYLGWVISAYSLLNSTITCGNFTRATSASKRSAISDRYGLRMSQRTIFCAPAFHVSRFPKQEIRKASNVRSGETFLAECFEYFDITSRNT